MDLYVVNSIRLHFLETFLTWSYSLKRVSLNCSILAVIFSLYSTFYNHSVVKLWNTTGNEKILNIWRVFQVLFFFLNFSSSAFSWILFEFCHLLCVLFCRFIILSFILQLFDSFYYSDSRLSLFSYIWLIIYKPKTYTF